MNPASFPGVTPGAVVVAEAYVSSDRRLRGPEIPELAPTDE